MVKDEKIFYLHSLYTAKTMTGFWRTIYYYAGWTYVSKNDKFDDRQIHLKYLCCKQIQETDVKKILSKECIHPFFKEYADDYYNRCTYSSKS